MRSRVKQNGVTVCAPQNSIEAFRVIKKTAEEKNNKFIMADPSKITPIQEDINGNLIEATEQLLKGAYGFICQYDDEPDFETVWSSVFDLESLIIYRAEGDPRKKKFLVDSRLHDIVQGK